MMLEKFDGPACPTCGCRDSRSADVRSTIWGNIADCRVCNHCSTQWEAVEAAPGGVYRRVDPVCRRCGSRMLVVRTAGRVQYLKCADCDETGKAIKAR